MLIWLIKLHTAFYIHCKVRILPLWRSSQISSNFNTIPKSLNTVSLSIQKSDTYLWLRYCTINGIWKYHLQLTFIKHNWDTIKMSLCAYYQYNTIQCNAMQYTAYLCIWHNAIIKAYRVGYFNRTIHATLHLIYIYLVNLTCTLNNVLGHNVSHTHSSSFELDMFKSNLYKSDKTQ